MLLVMTVEMRVISCSMLDIHPLAVVDRRAYADCTVILGVHITPFGPCVVIVVNHLLV